jgi:DtxR family Mn-dependent transcriptional regulator
LSSESVEEYLEAIYDFNEKGKLAKTTELAKKLNISPPSVTEMIKKLAKEARARERYGPCTKNHS